MALATDADVERALGRSLADEAEQASVALLLEEASDRVVAYLGHTPDPVPPAVTRAVARMVEKVLNKPTTTAGDYQAGGYNSSQQMLTYRATPTESSDPWLSKTIRDMLAPYRKGRGAFSITLTGEPDPPSWAPIGRRR